MKTRFILSIRAAACLAATAVALDVQAQLLWNESANGDLSNTQSAPSMATVAAGANSVVGTVGGVDFQDWITLHVPDGLQLSSLTLVSYASTDAQGFTGVQRNAVFAGSSNDPASYLGYAHFGTGAANGSLPVANLVGVDILPLMGNAAVAQGSEGFTPPLGGGDYAFLIQQLGSPTTYEFSYAATAVPEMSSSFIAALLCGALALARRLRARITGSVPIQ